MPDFIFIYSVDLQGAHGKRKNTKEKFLPKVALKPTALKIVATGSTDWATRAWKLSI